MGALGGIDVGGFGAPRESLVRFLVEVTPQDPRDSSHLHTVILDGSVYLGVELGSVGIGDVICINVEKVYHFGACPLHTAVQGSARGSLFGPSDDDTLGHKNGQATTPSKMVVS